MQYVSLVFDTFFRIDINFLAKFSFTGARDLLFSFCKEIV